MITVSDPRRTASDDGLVELSADVNGERLWFRMPASREPALRGEAFAACLLVPAMATGATLVLDDSLPLCPSFVAGVSQVMDVFRFWGPALHLKLRPIELRAALRAPPASRDAITFFSGGIDGLYTFLGAEAELSLAVFAHGIDFQLENPMAHEAVRLNREWLETRGTPLIEFASNARFVGHRFGIGWNAHNGLCLAGFAHALRAERGLIAASNAWSEFPPTGSHLVTDPLLSNATTTIEHTGFGPLRWQKLERVAREPGVLELLRVCWQDNGYNCGRCDKCRRTMLLLHLLGLQSSAFPPTATLKQVMPLPILDGYGADYARQARGLALRLGRHDVVREINRVLGRWQRRLWLVRADKAMLGGTLRRLKALGAGQSSEAHREPGPDERFTDIAQRHGSVQIDLEVIA